MKSSLTARLVAVAALATAALGAASVAQAGSGNFYLSIGVPQPAYYEPAPVHLQPRPVYVQPRPVYIAPRPVYVQPRPVYVQPRPVVVPAPAYGWYETDYGQNRGWPQGRNRYRHWERQHHDEDRHEFRGRDRD